MFSDEIVAFLLQSWDWGIFLLCKCVMEFSTYGQQLKAFRFPLSPPPSLNDGGGGSPMRLCTHTHVCQGSVALRPPHVFDIRNQTDANRMQVKLRIARTRTKGPTPMPPPPTHSLQQWRCVLLFSSPDDGRLRVTESRLQCRSLVWESDTNE